jgi:hypothetical protein
VGTAAVIASGSRVELQAQSWRGDVFILKHIGHARPLGMRGSSEDAVQLPPPLAIALARKSS